MIEMTSPPHKKKLKVISTNEESPTKLGLFFKDCRVFLIEHGIGKARCNIFQKQLLKYGARMEKTLTESVTHILVSRNLKKLSLLKLLKIEDFAQSWNFLSVEWLSECLMKGFKVDESPYRLFKVNLSVENQCNSEKKNLEKNENSLIEQKDISGRTSTQYEESDSKSSNQQPSKSGSYEELMKLKNLEADLEDDDIEEDSVRNKDFSKDKSKRKDITSKQTGVWACATPSSSLGVNHNSNITDKLAILEKSHTNTQERWKAFAYRKAITSIKNHHKQLETYQEVSNLPFVGERLAKKIWEIIETGHLRHLDHIDPKNDLLNKFSGVWGAGPKTAQQWVSKGYKNLKDIEDKADLTIQQKIGVEYYDDINEKMPREEVAEIEKYIRKTAESILPDVLVVVCGSYRRGRSFCGDIDLLVSYPDYKSHYGFLLKLLDALKENNLITEDLITVQKEKQRKYMGLVKLPKKNSKHRRIDFIVAPYSEWPCALLHFTGSAHFNRSIRLLAKKKGMSLSEHALRKNVIRNENKDEKLDEGIVVPIKSEKDIFQELELDYLEPHDRDW